MKFPAIIASVFLSMTALASAASTDWPAFPGRHDFRWQTLPDRWEEAAFIGNGNLGATIHLQEGKLSWEINRTDLYVQGSRIPVGHLSLETAGAVTGGDMRVDLWNAEAGGMLTTDRGTVRWRSITLREPGLILLEVTGEGGEPAPGVAWHPALARPARTTFNQSNPLRTNAPREEYKADDLHPPAKVVANADGFVGTQTYLKAGASATVARAHASPASGRRVFLVALEHAGSAGEAVSKAESVIKAARETPVETLFAAHRSWWHAYYPQSFVSLPDAPELEAFYWRQIYKFGSAMRPDGPILDLLGPWFRGTRWARIWWNMNLQLTYHPLTSSNRLELAESLFRNLDRNREQLIDNVLPARPQRDAAVIGRSSDQNLKSPVRISRTDGNTAGLEAGNLPWAVYLYWEYYRAQMDDDMLRTRVYPLLALAMGHYLTHTQVDADGVMHLRPTNSPEYAVVADCNYDLALFRWGLKTLVETCERLHIDDPRLPRWRDALARLTPFPVNEKGVLMIGEGLSLEEAHRHSSHLLAIYPLHLLDLDDPAERGLAERSIDDWIGLKGGYRMGFTHTGEASLLAALGRGDQALGQLNILMQRLAGKNLHPNTFYSESGGPVIETPLSVVSVVNEMLLQSRGGKVRVFPAVPATWQDASFERLRAGGAFLVSAVREGGHTRSVTIESLAGEPLKLKVPDWNGSLKAGGNRAFGVTEYSPGEYTIDLKAGESVRLAPAAPATPGESTSLSQHDRKMQWWREAKFGMFIHWGPYCLYGGMYEGHRQQRGGAEWIMNRCKIPVADYKAMAGTFNPVKFDAEKLVLLAKENGMKYIIFTAKHHDGFAMFKSAASDFNIVDYTPFKRDVAAELAAACRKHGMKLGFYYSQSQDWSHPGGATARKPMQEGWPNPRAEEIDAFTKANGGAWDPVQREAAFAEYLNRIAIPQLRELLRNYGDIVVVWWDTPMGITAEQAAMLTKELEAYPQVITNDRLRRPDFPGDYKTPEGRVPKLEDVDGIDWETCMNIGNSWGFRSYEKSWKSTETLVRNLISIAARGGNYLLNVGPDPEGEVPPEAVKRLQGMGAWIRKYGEVIYGSQRSPVHPSWGECIRKDTDTGTVLYLCIFDWPKDGKLVLPAGYKAGEAVLLPEGKALPVSQAGDQILLTVPAEAPDAIASVIRLELKEKLPPVKLVSNSQRAFEIVDELP